MTPSRFSLPATCLGLLAMITLLSTTTQAALWPLLLCVLALVATHLTTSRLERSSYVPLLVRGVMFPTIYFSSSQTSFGIDWLFDFGTMQMLGQMGAVELCLQHWKHQPSPEAGRFPISSLLVSSLVFLAGANVMMFRGAHIPLITPLFVFLLLWSLLDWKPALIARRAWSVVVACWGMAIAGGFGLHLTSMFFRNELMGLGSQLFREGILRHVIGTSDQPRLSTRFDLPDSPRRVLRVEGDLVDPHLRVASFDKYEGGAWSPPLSAREINGSTTEASLQSRPRAKPKTTAKASAALSKVRITRLFEMTGTPVFLPLNMVGVHALDSADIDGPTYDFERFSGLLRCTEPDPFTYEVTESAQSIQGVPTFQGALCDTGARLSREDRAKYLQLPYGFDARVTQIANEATINDDTPQARVESLARYLMSTHRYSREISIDTRRGPLSQFIVDKKDAHCEFFAAALALMCRGVGVPSRYVVGYLAHEPALGEPGVINVRQRDAHAWAEVWIEGVGWVTADATPGDGRPEAREEVGPTQKWGEWASDFLTMIRNRAAHIPRSTWGWITGVPLALWLIIRGRPQRAARGARDAWGYAASEGEAARRLEDLARDFEKWMANRKLSPPPSRSWNWFLKREQKDEAALWAEKYERARFGRVDEATLGRLEEDLRRMKAEAK